MASSGGNGPAFHFPLPNRIEAMSRNSHRSTYERRVWDVTLANGEEVSCSAKAGDECSPWMVDQHFQKMRDTADPLADLKNSADVLKSLLKTLIALEGFDEAQKTALEIWIPHIDEANRYIEMAATIPLPQVARQTNQRATKFRYLRRVKTALRGAADGMRNIIRLDDVRQRGVLPGSMGDWMPRFIAANQTEVLMWMNAYERGLFI